MRFHSAASTLAVSAAAIAAAPTTTTITFTSAFGVSPMAIPPSSTFHSMSSISGSRLVPRRATVVSSPSLSPFQRCCFGITPSSSTAHLSTISPPSSLSSSTLIKSPTSSNSNPSSITSTTLHLKGAGGGPEALEDYILTLQQSPSSSKSKSKSTKKLLHLKSNPKLLKIASAAALPLSYALGAAITPSRRLAARAIGGLVAVAAGGIVGKSAVEEDVRRSCPAAIARRLADMGVEDPNVADGILRLREDYGVNEEDFADMCTKVYSVYLVGMAKNPMTKTADLKELTNLKNALSLTNQQVGQAHYEGAKNFYRDVTRFTTKEELEDVDHPDRMALDKLLFFSERAYRMGGETDEAFTFEFARTSKALGVTTLESAMERVEYVAKPFYERALNSARAKLESGAVNSEMLARARGTLGLEERVAMEMHIEAFGKEVRVLLGLPEEEDDDDEDEEEGSEDAGKKKVVDNSGIKFQEGASERLSKLQDLLSLTPEDATYEILSTTEDYWRQTALSAMEDAISKTKTPAKAWSIIQNRQKELLITESNMKPLLTSLVMQALGRPLEKTNAFSRVGNAAATYDGLMDVLNAKAACKQVLIEAGWEEFEDFEERCFDPLDESSACGFLSTYDRENLYKTFFFRSLQTGENGKKILSDEGYAKLKEVRSILGLSDDFEKSEMQNFFGPELQRALTFAVDEILRGNTTDELMKTLKGEIEDVISSYKLEEEMVHFYSRPLYSRAVEQISRQTPGGIPTKDEVATLASIRDLLDIPIEETYDVHLRYFGESYKKGIKEALGSTGVIRPEFRKPLDELKGRLGVSDESAREIYLEALSERMVPMVKFISSEIERLVLTQDQLAQRRGKDYGEDFFKSGERASGKLGLGTEGNIMNDIMNLVDFYVENDIVEKQVVGHKKVSKKIPQEDGEGEEEKTVEEEIPVYESTYPITALGLGCIDQNVAELCYRQFLVGTFTDQTPNSARYESSKATFGGILGLTSEQMETVGGSIGEMIYDNYITQAMSTKEALDQQDMMFLANIQGKLGISSEQGEKMMLDTQKKIMSSEASALLDRESPSPEAIKAFREKCNKMGLELESDVGLSKSRLVNMFEIEITPRIDDGTITPENAGDIIPEIQDSLGLSEEEGEEVIEKLIVDRAKRLGGAINGLILRGLEAQAGELLRTMIQYAKFVDGELGLDLTDVEAKKAYAVFEKLDFSGVEEEEVESQKELLKIALGLSKPEPEEEEEES